MNGKKWTEEEVEFMEDMYPDVPSQWIADYLKRNIRSIYMQASIMGLRKTKEFKRWMDQQTGNNLAIHGAKFRFPKGHQSHNKGKKQIEFMSHEAIERSKNTRFKKGNLPKNTLYDGAIVIRHDHPHRKGRRYKWIRISKAKWEMLHVHNWKKVHGPIPEGYIVVFKTKGTMNCEPDNLELITREENMLRNTIHRYPEDIKRTIRTIGVLNRKIHQHEKQNRRPEKSPVRTDRKALR